MLYSKAEWLACNKLLLVLPRTKRREFRVPTQQKDKGLKRQTFSLHNQIRIHDICILSWIITGFHKYVKSCVYSNAHKEFLSFYYHCYHYIRVPVSDGEGVAWGRGGACAAWGGQRTTFDIPSVYEARLTGTLSHWSIWPVLFFLFQKDLWMWAEEQGNTPHS